MSKEAGNELGYILIASLTGASFGAAVFEIFGVFILGIVGALGGYLFNKVIKPKLDKRFNKKKDSKA